MTEKKELTNLTKEELVAEIAGLGEKSFRAKQLWQWIYFRGVTDFAEMSNLSLSLWKKTIRLPGQKLLRSRYP